MVVCSLGIRPQAQPCYTPACPPDPGLSPGSLGNSRESVCQSPPDLKGGFECWLRAGAALEGWKDGWMVGHGADRP